MLKLYLHHLYTLMYFLTLDKIRKMSANKVWLLSILLSIGLIGCTTSHVVNNERVFQKRKYSKGWFVSTGSAKKGRKITKAEQLRESQTHRSNRNLLNDSSRFAHHETNALKYQSTNENRTTYGSLDQRTSNNLFFKKHTRRAKQTPEHKFHIESETGDRSIKESSKPTTRADHRRVGWSTIISAGVLNIIGLILVGIGVIEFNIVAFWVIGIVMLIIGLFLLFKKKENSKPKWPSAKIWLFIGLGIFVLASICGLFMYTPGSSLIFGFVLAAPALLVSLFYALNSRYWL